MSSSGFDLAADLNVAGCKSDCLSQLTGSVLSRAPADFTQPDNTGCWWIKIICNTEDRTDIDLISSSSVLHNSAPCGCLNSNILGSYHTSHQKCDMSPPYWE